MNHFASWLLSTLAILQLTACAPPDFGVKPCELGDRIGFKIIPLDGWFRDYVPRPHSISVWAVSKQSYEEVLMWEAEMSYNDIYDREYDDARPRRQLIVYGQNIAGWKLLFPPIKLSLRQTYKVRIEDGFYSGQADFELGKPMPVC